MPRPRQVIWAWCIPWQQKAVLTGCASTPLRRGWIDTPMFHKATDGDQVRLGKILGRIPMQKVGSVTDIGMAAVFLSSDAAGIHIRHLPAGWMEVL